MQSAPRSVLAAMAMVSAGVMLVELGLTRILSVASYYHYSFLCVSLALFGLSASAVMVHLNPSLVQPGAALVWARRLALAFSLLVVGAAMVFTRLTPSPTTGGLALAALLGGAPLFAAGAFISILITWGRGDINRIYAADLAGAALGCMLVVPSLDLLGGLGPLLLAAGLGCAAAASLGRREALVGAALLLVWGGWQLWHPLTISKPGFQQTPSLVRWNSHSQVALYPYEHGDWGLSPRYRGERPKSYYLNIDASAATPILLANRPDQVRFLASEVTALGYTLLPPGARTLVIGPGGGRDLWTGLVFKASDITGVEVNRIIVEDIMNEAMLTLSGQIYRQPGVHVFCDDGRSFVARAPGFYDLIQASMVDTWAASSAGAFSLTENNLYTVEALQDYLSHLTPDGLLSLTRWEGETPRMIVLAREAVRRAGLNDLSGRLFIAGGPREALNPSKRTVDFILKRTPFEPGELSQLQKHCSELGFEILYQPGALSSYADLVRSPALAALIEAAPEDLSAVTDDRPFFFQYSRLDRLLAHPAVLWSSSQGLPLLLRLLALSVLLVVAFVLVPLRIRPEPQGELSRSAQALFACLGVGYMLLEISLAQRFALFLGLPVYALTVVLFTMLLGSALGSALVYRGNPRAILGGATALAALGSIAYTLVLPGFIQTFLPWERPARIALTVAFLLPLAAVMGMPLPAAIAELSRHRPRTVTWAWAINGATSVAGSCLAVVMSVCFGFQATGLLAGACYALAFWMAPGVWTSAPRLEADIPSLIETLGRLRDEGLLTADEFHAKKQELLQRL